MKGGKPIIGLCGGIGSGKSTVAQAFAELGCRVIDSDQLNHEVLQRPEVRQTLRAWWGERVFGPDGRPDRAEIARIVFADRREKERLEGLVYPLIARRRAAMIREVEENSAIRAIVIDSPLLFESNLDRECDYVVCVDASEEQRLRRLQQSRGWTQAELRRRERWQTSLNEKRKRADFVVDNNGSPNQIGPQLAGILQDIVARHSS